MIESRFSPFILGALVDTITGGAPDATVEPVGIYRSGGKIEQFFLDCGFEMQIGAAGRVPATTAAIRQARGRPDGDAILERLIVKVCDPREYLAAPEKAEAVCQRLNAALEPDGLSVTVVGGRALLVERHHAGAVVEPFLQKVKTINFDTVQVEIARALQSLESDPEDAVTAACSLVEAVCRSILIELAQPLPPRKDIEGLLKAVQVSLNLSPGRSDLPPEVEDDVRQVLSGLTTVVKGVGALRTHGGDAHGRQRGFPRIDARIAHLALSAASSAALFLIQTWERQQHRALPRHGDAFEPEPSEPGLY